MIGEYREPNMYITFNPEDEAKVRAAMESIYQFREKGKHSIHSNISQVDYWVIEKPGLCSTFTYAALRLQSEHEYSSKLNVKRTQKVYQIFNKLEEQHIDYMVCMAPDKGIQKVIYWD